MKLAIGTKNKAKIKALTDASKKCVYFKDNIQIEGHSVISGVADQPKSLEETMQGAKNRAENLKNNGYKADFYVGMEGGLTQIDDKVYLFGVTYITNNTSQGHFGLTQFQEIPDVFKQRTFLSNEELGAVQDDIMGEVGNNHKGGSFAAWTDDMLSRSTSFESSFFCAISPFFNKYYK